MRAMGLGISDKLSTILILDYTENEKTLSKIKRIEFINMPADYNIDEVANYIQEVEKEWKVDFTKCFDFCQGKAILKRIPDKTFPVDHKAMQNNKRLLIDRRNSILVALKEGFINYPSYNEIEIKKFIKELENIVPMLQDNGNVTWDCKDWSMSMNRVEAFMSIAGVVFRGS